MPPPDPFKMTPGIAPEVTSPDPGLVDPGSADRDSGLVDSGLVDSGLVDSGLVDSGLLDRGLVNKGLMGGDAPAATQPERLPLGADTSLPMPDEPAVQATVD